MSALLCRTGFVWMTLYNPVFAIKNCFQEFVYQVFFEWGLAGNGSYPVYCGITGIRNFQVPAFFFQTLPESGENCLRFL